MKFSITRPLEDLAATHFNNQNDYCLLAPRSLAGRIDPSLLTNPELERMQLFRFEADRERFLVAHGLKRLVLSKVLQCHTHNIPLKSGLGNKPLIAGGQCHFNLSHSGNWIAMLLSFKTQIGVDLEEPKPSMELPLALVCHPDDRFHAELQSPAQRFYASWTLKEAMSKWDGRGLDRPFNEIRLEPMADSSYRGHHEGVIWHARHTVLHDGTHLAYATENPLMPLHMFLS